MARWSLYISLPVCRLNAGLMFKNPWRRQSNFVLISPCLSLQLEEVFFYFMDIQYCGADPHCSRSQLRLPCVSNQANIDSANIDY